MSEEQGIKSVFEGKKKDIQNEQMFGYKDNGLGSTKMKLDDLKHGKEIESHYLKLHEIINNLDQKVAGIVKTYEEDFFFAYKD